MRRIQATAIFILVTISSGISQKHTCGVLPGDENSNRLRRNIAASNEIAYERDDFVYLPMHFIITTDDTGNGAIKEDRILDAMCTLNELYETMGFQFYIDAPVEYLVSNAIYDQSTSSFTERNNIFNSNKKDSTINVFIGDVIPSGNSAYYTSASDVIYMDKQYVNSSFVILAHEVGHYFSLRHPFYGWESMTYNPDEPTPTTLFFNGSAIQVEFVDREENCETAADLMCGTPADYILDWDGGCNYTGGAIDPDSVAIDPDESNIMGYYSFTNCSDYKFSEDQMEAMMADYTFRPEINNIPDPNLELVTEAPTGLYPINDEVVDGNNPVQLSWTEVENADQYILEFSPSAPFILVTSTHIVDQATFLLEDIDLSNDYYWRVKAINKTDLCGDWIESDVYEFETKDLVDIKTNPWPEAKIYPNPTTNILYVSGITLVDKTITITNILGNRMSITINPNNNTIATNTLPSGTYLLSIGSKESLLTKKIFVQ